MSNYSSGKGFQVSSVCVLPLMYETKFYTHIQLRLNIYFCILTVHLYLLVENRKITESACPVAARSEV
jgi:hypothetical protein